jgi:UDP-N-acetylglucosamine diphosphorylase / glucose-1-phosphate thymidylyltransferase / UDP-N-acetylgalactosamine diphosphorylase / glucosamine-1-phosphate N-acetyltransferase / galactosamine-1-phosphate N-acetyltransferase
MMNQIFLSDKEIKDNLFPFTLTRSAADIRIGILTIREKWNFYTGSQVALAAEGLEIPDNAAIVSANIVPSAEFVSSLITDGGIADDPLWSSVKIIQYPWHIFMWNDWAIREDFKLVTSGRHSEPIPEIASVSNASQIFIEKGAKVSHCVINAANGPVYIGENAEVMEGSLLRGPLAICEGAVVKMGAKIYGATTIGPYSIVGGEIKNAVIFGYSNKAHDGYLGDSVLGEWCNLGAGTSNSNMKNNVSEVRMWNYNQKQMIATGITKCGLIMGDYSRSAINTSFNTGTIVGICANVFGQDEMPKFIPSFTWGKSGSVKYEYNKAVDDIEKWKKLKGHDLDEKEKTRLKLIFDEN